MRHNTYLTKLIVGWLVITGAGAYAQISEDTVPSSPATVTPAPDEPQAGRGERGGRRGRRGRRGRGGRGGRGGGPVANPATPEELAVIATLKELPLLTPDSGIGDFRVAPPYPPAPEETPRAGVPKGRLERFTLNTANSEFFPGPGRRGGPPTREVVVYIPANHVAGTPMPFMVTADAYGVRADQQLPALLDNMIADKRVPAMVIVMVNSGGQRSLEYDTVSGKYADFVEAEVLPRVEREFGLTLTKDPEGRGTMGGSSGAAASFSMAWFHPDRYRRVMSYSGTFVRIRPTEDVPDGAWAYHEHLIRESPVKPLRIWLHVSDNDFGATTTAADKRNWVIANMRMAAELKAKGYPYQFVYSEDSGHTDRAATRYTMAEALEWLWQDYEPASPAR